MMEGATRTRAEFHTIDRVPPQNVEAERAVLGGVLLEPEAATKAIEIVSPECFYRPAHQKIFQAMITLFTKREAIDVMTLGEELKKSGDLDALGGITALTDLVDGTPTAANIELYARIVLDKFILRQLIRASTDIAEDAYAASREADAILDSAEQKIFKISESRVSQGFVHIKDILKERFEEIQHVHETRTSVTGLPSGFIDLDKYTAGFHPSDLVIIAGRPSMGKTSFALNIAQYLAIKEKIPVGVFSLEMSSEQLVMRLLCSEAKVDSHALRMGYLKHSEFPKLAIVAGYLSEAPLYIDDSAGVSMMELRAKARRLKAEVNVGAIFIDYLQLITVREPTENRQQQISTISRGLKSLAKELDIPVVCLSQLSRAVEARGGERRPMLSDLRESGAIEQDADTVLMLYRPAFYEGENSEDPTLTEVIIAKQRNGPTGTVKLAFLREYTRFERRSEE